MAAGTLSLYHCMRKLVLFIASSLDGYIAGGDEQIDWLFTDQDYGYSNFYDSIDTTISGYKTYRLSLSFDSFPYPDKKNYVFTRDSSRSDTELVQFISGDIVQFTRELKQQPGRDIWLVGGGEINTVMLDAGLIDEIVLSIHPVIVGQGIPLFGGAPALRHFTTLDTTTFSTGLVQLKLGATP